MTNAKLHNSLYIGCPIWTHNNWFGHLYPPKSARENSLTSYSRYFNSIEGNSSFYHLPDIATLQKWREAVPDTFRFTLKFPQTISHQKSLWDCDQELQQTLSHFAVLGDKLGSLMLQLPARFAHDALPRLDEFLGHIPSHFHCAVEVRHPAFFNKAEEEQQLNRLLLKHKADRVIMDTRGLFACQAQDYPSPERELIEAVQQAKPRVPTHAIATGMRPIVRLVGHQDIAQTRQYYQPWLAKINQWLDEGKSPSLFFHMPDNQYAPWLAKAFLQDLHSIYPHLSVPTLSLPELSLPEANSQQLGMFD